MIMAGPEGMDGDDTSIGSNKRQNGSKLRDNVSNQDPFVSHSRFVCGMRLIRAHNDLHQLNNSARRDIGYRLGELDRVVQGHRPRMVSN